MPSLTLSQVVRATRRPSSVKLYVKVTLVSFILTGLSISLSQKRLAKKRNNPIENAVQEATICTRQVEPFVVMTAASYPYRAFVFNLWCSLQKYGKRKLLVMSLDREMHEYAVRQGMTTVYFPSDRTTSRLEYYGTPQFNRLTIAKLYAVRAVLDSGTDVFFVDSDTAFCNDPAVVMRDVQKQSVGHGVGRGSDFVMQRYYDRIQVLNSGVYYARATNRTKALLDALIASKQTGHDQDAFNAVLCGEKNSESKRIYANSNETGAYEAVGCIWRNETTASFLSQRQFPIGCSIIDGVQMARSNFSMVQRMCANGVMTAMHVSCWHANGKKGALKARGLWYTRKNTSTLSLEQDECVAA